jgi:hypothetical protein
LHRKGSRQPRQILPRTRRPQGRPRLAGYALAVFLSLLGGIEASAAPPLLEQLEPARATSRALVIIRGQNLENARIIWDAGLASARVLKGALQGAVLFSIPPGTIPGDHRVAVENDDGRSAEMVIEVLPGVPRAVPRVDHVTLVQTSFQPDGTVATTLYVQGPNVDVSATVLVDGTDHASVAHKALPNDLVGTDPSVLGFPIQHYLTRLVPLSPRPVGSHIVIQVRNEGGEISAERNFQLPVSAETIDSDGDGIPDIVELNGYDAEGAGSTRVDLKALGADPFRKDVFVELDVMQNISRPPMQRQGAQPGTIEVVREMFANAPILNPLGPSGINLFVDASGTVPFWPVLEFRAAHDQDRGVASFGMLKNEHFTPARRGLFHYAIWGRAHPLGWSGESNIDYETTKVGNDFMITLDGLTSPYQTLKTQAATFAHEFGHNLGQRHGGSDHVAYKPNYWSVMSYAWQTRTGWTDAERARIPTCAQIYYGAPDAIEVNGALPPVVGFVIDYSEGMGPDLVTNDGSLSEKKGVCGQPIDWNGDGLIADAGVSASVAIDSPLAIRIADHPNWPNLLFDGPRLGGRTFQ